MKARQPGERLRAHADGLPEYATEVSLAHAELGGDGAHVAAREPVGRLARETRVSAAWICGSEPFGDRALHDRSRIDRGARGGEPLEEPSRRGVTPQLIERDDAPGDCRGRHAEHGLRRAQL